MSVRVGVIGVGVMGAEHARVVQSQVGGARISAVTDIDLTRAGGVAAGLGAEVLPDPAALVTSDDVDAILVASLDAAHAEQVSLCLKAGKPVLCEKPLAPTVAECQALVAAQDALGLERELISVGFMRRFHPAFVALREELRSGRLGAPLLVRGSHRNVASYPWGGSEGTITNSAVHDIDSTAWMLDSPIVEVSWHAPKPTSTDTTRHDPQLIHLRTADGVLTVVDVFVNARYGYDIRYEVVGELGAAQLGPSHLVQVDRDLRSSHSYPDDWRPFFADAYRLELQEWVDAVSERRTPTLATATDGARATLVAHALIESMKNGGQVVRIDTP